MAKDRPARRRPDHATRREAAVEPIEAQWPPAIDRRQFRALALIPMLIVVCMSARGVSRPFEGLHAWAQADSAWFSRNHVRYGLGYTRGVMTIALGDPPPANPQRYYDHPQYGGLLGAATMLLFGVNEWALRLSDVLLSLVILSVMLMILRRFLGNWPALTAAVLLAMFPVSAYFGLGGWLTLFALGASWTYLVISGQVPEKQARWWHYVGLGALLFACVQISWSGFFYAAAIVIHYVLRCIFRRRWPQWGLLAVMVLAPLASAIMVFTNMLWGFNWDYQRIIDLYKWRAAKGEMTGQMTGDFDWGAWFRRAWEFGLTNFTLPVLLATGGYLVYLAVAHIYRLICRLLGQAAGAVAQPFPLALLFLLPGLLQMFILRGALWPHQYWERPLGPFIAIAAALGIIVLGRLLLQAHRAVAVAVMAGAVLLCGWASVEGANYYYGIVWNCPEKIAMWKELNRRVRSDKELATFDRELDNLVVTQSQAKGAVYRGEPAWYIDRIIVDANTPEQVEALATSEKATVYLLPYPRSLGYGKYGPDVWREVFEKHNRIAEYLVKRYPVISQYPGVEGKPDGRGGILKFGMRPYLLLDLTRPGEPNFQPQAGPADR
jgi:4-amino-4-deoxy-L-arabinose transferase-like glycosyltransferase